MRREFDVSYWPVRRRGDDEILGVGCVVTEVTERRAADRALREQTARYESLLRALSEVGEGMIVLEDERLRVRQPGLPRHLAATRPRSCRRCRRCSTSSRTTSARTPQRRAQLRLEGVTDPGYQLTLRHRDGHRVPLEIAGVPLEIGGRTQMVVVGRDVTARARAEAEREWLLERSAFLAEASASFDAVLDEERDPRRARAPVGARPRRHLRDPARLARGAIRRVACVARDPTDERMLHELVERYPFADRRSHPLLDVLATGRSRLVEHPDGPDIPAVDERHRELMEHFSVKSTVLAPLRARGRTLGVMALGFADVVGADHVRAVRGPRAPRRARRSTTRASTRSAPTSRSTLQRSLLPPVLPDVPGIELAARYLRGRRGQRGRRRLLRLLPHRRRRAGRW